MIEFDDIQKRLKSIGKDRAWLAKESGRSPDSIRAGLAPSSAGTSKRSIHLQKGLSDAIEAEEQRQRDAAAPVEQPPMIPMGYSAIYLAGSDLEKAESASRQGPWKNLAEFCRDAIRVKADEILEQKGKMPFSVVQVADDPAPYGGKSSPS